MFELHDAEFAGVAAPAFSSPNCVHSLLYTWVALYAVGYSLCGGFRMRCWIRLCLARHPVFSMLIAYSHRCMLELRRTAVSALSVSRLWFELYYAATSGVAAAARATHSVYVVGYSQAGLGCWIRWYPLLLLGFCFELYEAAVSGAAVLALSSDCVHTPVYIRFAVVLFPLNPGHVFYFLTFTFFFSRTTQHGIVVPVLTTI